MILERIKPPTADDMARASGLGKEAVKDWLKYCKNCRKRFAIVRDIVKQRFDGNLRGKVILDWGSAAGGVAILAQEEFPVEMHAADVDAHSLAWLGKTNPAIQCTRLIPGKVLSFADDTFDCIYGISVLTHIPPELQEFYLGELRRVSKKNALVILTVMSYASCDASRVTGKNPNLHPYDPEELKKRGIIYHSYPDSILGSMDFTAQGGDYGITYHSREYVTELFGRYFEVEAIKEGVMGKQDVVIMAPIKG